jgi:hypothetical protein
MIYQCNHCRIGRLHAIKTPYLSEVHGHIMVVPDSPAFHCDMCSQITYDEAFLKSIQDLIDQFIASPLSQKAGQWRTFEKEFIQPISPRRSS